MISIISCLFLNKKYLHIFSSINVVAYTACLHCTLHAKIIDVVKMEINVLNARHNY